MRARGPVPTRCLNEHGSDHGKRGLGNLTVRARYGKDDLADDHRGDWWDHVALDAEGRSVLAVAPGARDAEEVIGEVKDRAGGRMLDLMTSDDYPAYETALWDASCANARRT